ncbi:MAG: hypothetical protein ACE5FD_00440 [Anaerolineae bacterium]
MYPTIEVRWFYQGEVPTAVFDWFTAVADRLVREPVRTDHYLQLLTHDGLGIKLREGRIEIKQRLKIVQTVQFEEQISGMIEQWHKWSFLLSEQNSLTESINTSQWIAVEKLRHLQSFQSNQDKKRQTRFSGLPMDFDCWIELTNLNVQNEKWWTLGLESYGDDETAVNTKLIPAVAWLGSFVNPPQLDAQASFGYPHWLLSILKGM